jgi:hypothetical protein
MKLGDYFFRAMLTIMAIIQKLNDRRRMVERARSHFGESKPLFMKQFKQNARFIIVGFPFPVPMATCWSGGRSFSIQIAVDTTVNHTV